MQRICIWAALFFLSGAQAQVASSTDAAVTPSQEELDQVIVRGTSPKALAALREEMIRLEDNFFDRYNELNTIKDFDVHCAAETSVGTRLKRRRCQANYMRDALAAEGAGHMEFLKKHPPSLGKDPPLIDHLPPPAIMDIEIRRKEYQQNLVDVSKKHPELAQMLSKLSELNNRYRTIQRSRGKAP
jgi:hypothetical protein